MALLFAYGSLKYEKGLEKFKETAVKGQLRDTEEGWAAARFDLPGKIQGILFNVGEKDLKKFDVREDHGYERMEVNTLTGEIAWAYEYTDEDFYDLKLVPSGRWTKP